MRSNRDEQGSIVMMLIVTLITSGLIMALLAEVTHGQRLSRQAGESANALQVADAGLNDAVQAIPTTGASPFTRSAAVGTGSYTYTATQDATNTATWHIDSVGTDASGAKRHLLADAVGQSEFSSPMYVNSVYSIGAGALIDSYRSGLDNTTGCTKKGFVSISNGGANPSFTSGGKGSANCQGVVLNNGWVYAMDGCIVWGGSSLPPTGQGQCPPSTSTIVSSPFPLVVVVAPPTVTYPSSGAGTGSFTCNAGSGVNSLQAGATYYYATITLAAGCGISAATGSGPVHMYAKDFIIGSASKGQINAPSAAGCTTSTAGWSYVDANKNPAYYYCPLWSQNLQLNVLSGSNGSITFTGSGTNVWAIIDAPDAVVTLSSPQLEMWGAMVAGSASVKSQFSWHYDESAASVTTGKYSILNWREVGNLP